MVTQRRGLGKGKGTGYKNIICKDPMVHKQSAMGIKQPQKTAISYNYLIQKRKVHLDKHKDVLIKHFKEFMKSDDFLLMPTNEQNRYKKMVAHFKAVDTHKSMKEWFKLYELDIAYMGGGFAGYVTGLMNIAEGDIYSGGIYWGAGSTAFGLGVTDFDNKIRVDINLFKKNYTQISKDFPDLSFKEKVMLTEEQMLQPRKKVL